MKIKSLLFTASIFIAILSIMNSVKADLLHGYPNLKGKWEGKVQGYINVEKGAKKYVKDLTWNTKKQNGFYTSDTVINITYQENAKLKGQCWLAGNKEKTLTEFHGIMAPDTKTIFIVSKNAKVTARLLSYDQLEYAYTIVIPGKIQMVCVGNLINEKRAKNRASEFMSFHSKQN